MFDIVWHISMISTVSQKNWYDLRSSWERGSARGSKASEAPQRTTRWCNKSLTARWLRTGFPDDCDTHQDIFRLVYNPETNHQQGFWTRCSKVGEPGGRLLKKSYFFEPLDTACINFWKKSAWHQKNPWPRKCSSSSSSICSIGTHQSEKSFWDVFTIIISYKKSSKSNHMSGENLGVQHHLNLKWIKKVYIYICVCVYVSVYVSVYVCVYVYVQ